MRICFVMLSHWSGTLGGAEIQVRYLMEYLRSHSSHELSMICRHTAMESENGMPIHRTSTVLPLSRYFKSTDGLSVMRLLRAVGPDVVYTRVSSPFVGFAARYCRSAGRGLVYHIAHREDVVPFRLAAPRYLPKWLERPVYEYGLRHTDAIIAQAEYQAQLLERHYGRKAAAIVPNFHPVPNRREKPEGATTVLWVANLKTQKQPELFLALSRRCAHLPGVRFVMVGAIQDDRYRALAQEAERLGNLTYLGQQPLEAVNELLESARLFVNTSAASAEGFPNTFIQAWLRSVPVASLEVDPDEILKRNEVGFCAAGSFERLVTDLLALLADPVRLAAMGERARGFAEATYGLGNCARVRAIIEEAGLRRSCGQREVKT